MSDTPRYTTCNLCEAMCGLVVTTRSDDAGRREVVRIEPDKDDPLSRGHICPKATALADINTDPDRLRLPQVRTSKPGEVPVFRTVTWDEAFERAAALIRKVQDTHGDDALGLYLGNPNVHSLGTSMFLVCLTKALRTKSRFSATSVDQLPHQLASLLMFGHQFMVPVADLDRSQLVLMLGANPVVSGGSMMTAPGFARRIKAMQERGGRLVVVDPRRTRTAELADQHLFIRPGTDAFFLAALVREVLQLDETATRCPPYARGLDALREAVAPWTAERQAERTGVPAQTVAELAALLWQTEGAVAYGRMGVSTQAFGGVCQWLLYALNVITGNLDVEGGFCFPTPAVDLLDPRRAGRFATRPSRVRGVPDYSGEQASSTLAEEILTPGAGQLRGMVTVAGNPLLSVPGATSLTRAFESLEAYVAIDIYINETTCHADVILPPTTGLETERYDVVFHNFAVRNTAKYSPPVLPPRQDQKADWEIFRGLARALADEATGRRFDESIPYNSLAPAQALDFALQSGPHELSLAKLDEHPHGLDLGPLQTGTLPGRLLRDDKQVDLAPDLYLSDFARLERAFAEDDDGLRLIGRRSLLSNNSWMHNSRRLNKGRDRCTLLMHPDDAAQHGLAAGDLVELRAVALPGATPDEDAGACFPLEVSDEMMPGVVCAPHGFGHHAPGARLRVAAERPGANVNAVTDPERLDALTGNAVVNGVPVSLRRVPPPA